MTHPKKEVNYFSCAWNQLLPGDRKIQNSQSGGARAGLYSPAAGGRGGHFHPQNLGSASSLMRPDSFHHMNSDISRLADPKQSLYNDFDLL